MTNLNKEFAFRVLFEDPETGEELRPICDPTSNKDGFIIHVSNKSGTRKWRHVIHTEEM